MFSCVSMKSFTGDRANQQVSVGTPADRQSLYRRQPDNPMHRVQLCQCFALTAGWRTSERGDNFAERAGKLAMIRAQGTQPERTPYVVSVSA